MTQIRSKNTKPELIVRSLLHNLGFRFRLHKKDLPGKPDIVLSKHKAIIFVNGCFWHQHQNCKKATIPITNHDMWQVKLNRNIQRDEDNIYNLKMLGWKVITIWECELKDTNAMKVKLLAHLNS